jgi:hypothetical protein
VGEAISAHLASLAKHGEPVPPAEGQGPAPAPTTAPLGRLPHVTGRVVLAALRRGGFSLDAVAGRQHVLLGAGVGASRCGCNPARRCRAGRWAVCCCVPD